MRVDSSAHRSSSCGVAGDHAGEHLGMQRRAARASSRARRTGSSWSRCAGARRHGRCPACGRARRCRPTAARSRSRNPLRSRSGSASSSPTASSKPCERGALDLLVARRDVGHAIGMHERVGAVELIEIGHEPVEPRRLGGGVADPARETEPVADPAGEPERVERAFGARARRARGRARGRGARGRSPRPARRRDRARACAPPRTAPGGACARACGSRRVPCWHRVRAARRTRGRPAGENTNRYRSRPDSTSKVSPSSARRGRERGDRIALVGIVPRQRRTRHAAARGRSSSGLASRWGSTAPRSVSGSM